jgi:DNA-binding transcriptional MerR regulator
MPAQTITAFARRYGLSRTTLLYYDRIGLLRPAAVNAAGYRLYGEPEAARMQRIDTFRKAGLPLAAIRDILDGHGGDAVEAALETRLAAINGEIALLRAQQRLIVQLLHRGGQALHTGSVDVVQWVAMLAEAGVDEAGRLRWHQAFERDAPAAHQEFLVSLGLDAAEVAEIRRRSRTAAG